MRSSTSATRELVWLAVAAVSLLFALWSAVFFHRRSDPSAQLAARAERLTAVQSIRAALATISEAQNSAVMANTEQDVQAFAARAQGASTILDRERTHLEQLLASRNDPQEQALLTRVNESLAQFQRIAEEMMSAAVQSSNREAFALAFGPGMKLLQEIDAELAQLVATPGDANADRYPLVVHISEARIGILRMQVLLAPHIAEQTEAAMDAFENQLAMEEKRVEQALKELATLLPADAAARRMTIEGKVREFSELKSRIIRLSRANTNVRAEAMALNEKRLAMLACQDALAALEQAIHAEVIDSTIPRRR